MPISTLTEFYPNFCKALLRTLVMLLFPLSALSAEWTPPLELGSIRVHPDYVAVHFPDPLPPLNSNLENCKHSKIISISRSSPIYADALSTMLAAKLGNKKIRFYVDVICFNEIVAKG